MNTGKVTYSAMKNFLRDLEVAFGATVTPPITLIDNQIITGFIPSLWIPGVTIGICVPDA